MRNKLLSMVFLFFMLLLVSGFSYQSQGGASGQNAELEKILMKCAEYCERLSNSVLFFVCKEKVVEEILEHSNWPTLTLSRKEADEVLTQLYRNLRRSPQRVIRKVYLYDYQLIRKNREITEKRKLLKLDGKAREEENATLQTRFHHKNIITGPIGLLSSYWQMFHEYRIVKEGRLKGDKVYIIEATPKSGFTSNHLFGKIWVRKSDFAIMKIEWEQDGIEDYEIIKEQAEAVGLLPRIKLTTEYGFEKKGIRFPSKYQIVEEYSQREKSFRRFIYSKKIVVYEDYKFFTVETKVKFSELKLTLEFKHSDPLICPFLLHHGAL